jgi:hypothetical protein
MLLVKSFAMTCRVDVCQLLSAHNICALDKLIVRRDIGPSNVKIAKLYLPRQAAWAFNDITQGETDGYK